MVINTSAVLTVTYGGSDSFTVNSLTVGNDVFDLAGGTLTITTTASFADGFTQTAGTLTAGGTVAIKGTGTLTGGSADGNTAFVFDGTVALGDYILGGAASLSNKKTTNLTNQITLGDDTGINATIVNEKGGTFDIGGDFGISAGALTAHFANAGRHLEKTGGDGTSTIAVNVTDSGTIVCGTGTIEFIGADNSFAGAISGNGQFEIGSGDNQIGAGTSITAADFTITDPNTSVTLDGNLELRRHLHPRERGGSRSRRVHPVAVRHRHLERGDRRRRHARYREGQQHRCDLVHARRRGRLAEFGHGRGGRGDDARRHDLQRGHLRQPEGRGVRTREQCRHPLGCGPRIRGLSISPAPLSRGSSTNANAVFVEMTEDSGGTIVVESGTLEFLGAVNGFAGAISGKGQFEIGGGESQIAAGTSITAAGFGINVTLVTLGGSLSYAGDFSLENAALMIPTASP